MIFFLNKKRNSISRLKDFYVFNPSISHFVSVSTRMCEIVEIEINLVQYTP